MQLHLQYITVEQGQSIPVPKGWDIRKIDMHGGQAHILLQNEEPRPFRTIKDALKDD